MLFCLFAMLVLTVPVHSIGWLPGDPEVNLSLIDSYYVFQGQSSCVQAAHYLDSAAKVRHYHTISDASSVLIANV